MQSPGLLWLEVRIWLETKGKVRKSAGARGMLQGSEEKKAEDMGLKK